MVSAKTLIAILRIIKKYNDTDMAVDAQHDIIYFYLEKNTDRVSDEDHIKLLELGCHGDEGYAVFT